MNEKEFISKVISEWDTIGKKFEQKELLKIIFSKLEKLDKKLKNQRRKK
jgi:hypothetical protein